MGPLRRLDKSPRRQQPIRPLFDRRCLPHAQFVLRHMHRIYVQVSLLPCFKHILYEFRNIVFGLIFTTWAGIRREIDELFGTAWHFKITMFFNWPLLRNTAWLKNSSYDGSVISRAPMKYIKVNRVVWKAVEASTFLIVTTNLSGRLAGELFRSFYFFFVISALLLSMELLIETLPERFSRL